MTDKSASPEHAFGSQIVGPVGIVGVTVYLVLFSLLLIFGLVRLWPEPAGDTSTTTASTVSVLFWDISTSDEIRLLLIVAMAGALGSLVHAIRSVYWYVGHRKLVRSWLIMYVLLPFVGASLGLVFYLVIRGGFFSAEATTQQTSPFGFAAVGALVGMFSQQAILKLKAVAETLLAQPAPGDDSVPERRKDEAGG